MTRSNDLNSEGVALLHKGRKVDALRNFREAMVCVQAEMAELHDRQLEMISESSEHRILCVGVGSEEDALYSQSSPHNRVALFNKAFALELVNPDVGSGELLTAIVLYNTGLYYHLCAIMSGNKGRFHKAKSIYRMGLDILRGNEDASVDLSLLSMAIFTNLAHISSHFAMDAVARELLGLVKKILKTRSVYDDNHADEYSFFYLLSMSQQGQLSPAPAA